MAKIILKTTTIRQIDKDIFDDFYKAWKRHQYNNRGPLPKEKLDIMFDNLEKGGVGNYSTKDLGIDVITENIIIKE